jgi:hypothetical protein
VRYAQVVVEGLPPVLRRELDAEPVRAIVEYLAGRLGLTVGEREIAFTFTNGALRRAHVHASPIRNEELEQLARAAR